MNESEQEIYTTCTSVTTNPTGNVILSADIIAERLSSVYSAVGKILAATNSRTIREMETVDTMADNRGHGLISTGNGTACLMI